MESPTNRIPDGKDTRAERGNVSISEAFEVYRQVCAFKNQSHKTEEQLLCACRLLIAYFGDIAITSLTFDLIRRWKQDLEKTRSPSTVRGYVIKLRVVLKYCRDNGYPVINPDTIPVPQRSDTVPTFISEHDVDLLIKNAYRARSKAIIAFLYASGVRVSELCNLDRGQIHDRTFTIVGKGGKARLCFIDQRADYYLNRYLKGRTDNNKALFTSQTGARVSPTNAQLVIRKAASNAGLGDRRITPHTLRHSFSRNFLVNNGNMRFLQQLLGHSSLETTQKYAHVVDTDLKKVYEEHHSIK